MLLDEIHQFSARFPSFPYLCLSTDALVKVCDTLNGGINLFKHLLHLPRTEFVHSRSIFSPITLPPDGESQPIKHRQLRNA
jgi:hypothetical protein